MLNLKISDVRPFIPAQDFAISKAFYEALGWKVGWSDEKLALLESDGHSFYLQAYYVKDWAENTMLHITVQDAQACYAQIEPVIDSEHSPTDVFQMKDDHVFHATRGFMSSAIKRGHHGRAHTSLPEVPSC